MFLRQRITVSTNKNQLQRDFFLLSFFTFSIRSYSYKAEHPLNSITKQEKEDKKKHIPKLIKKSPIRKKWNQNLQPYIFIEGRPIFSTTNSNSYLNNQIILAKLFQNENELITSNLSCCHKAETRLHLEQKITSITSLAILKIQSSGRYLSVWKERNMTNNGDLRNPNINRVLL